jgi:threonine dehydrogenase-like Zn-dependent dehydrogenase
MPVRAAVIPQPGGPVEIREFPEPELEPGAVLLRTLYTEVCGTDVHLLHGQLDAAPYPLIPGHINVGTIDAMAGEVTDALGDPLSEGDLVTFLDVHETCNACWQCLVARATTRCPSRRVYGITYGAEEGLLGGWAEKIYLKPGVKIARLPDGLTPETFIAGGCALPTAFHAIERGEVGLGDTVIVQGSGPVGLMATALARLAGANRVILIGAPDRRLHVGRRLGADETVSIELTTAADRRERVLALTDGHGADVTIEATGSPDAIREGMRLTRDAGVYVVVGQYTDAGETAINPHHDLNRKHLDVRGCWGIDFSHFYRSLQVLARNKERFPWEAVISRYYALDEAAQALDDVAHLRVVKAVLRPNG